ncbi:MAG TPA: C10 family peptidase [Williamwhitmania sp.]|nr:C10 family peptidase [Williamwhitmania sp.]
MKRITLIFSIILLGVNSCLKANPVSLESAQAVAEIFFQHYSSRSVNTVSDAIVYKGSTAPEFYVFTFQGGGFVIVAADDAVTPILGYSTTSIFDKDNVPINAQDWLNSYKGQISDIVAKRIDNTQTLNEWNKIRNGQFSATRGAVAPLITTTWDQGCYYNQLCPSDPSATTICKHAYTGCVATTMAQIMKYWNYPNQGNGSHTYTDLTYGSLSADFGSTTFNWANMPNYIADTNIDVATLMYECGVSVDMAYGADGSGAFSGDVPAALINYFSYSPTAEIKSLGSFTTDNWILMIKNELDAQRPVYYAGDNGTEGHAFVCDGYDSYNNFHFNWGWSGYANGYYPIGALNPTTSYKFNYNNEVIVRIKPSSNAPIASFTASTTIPDVNTPVTFTDKSANSPTSWKWYFEGGTPSTSADQNPQVTYDTKGSYLVSLTVTNADGNDIKTISGYISVGGASAAWVKQNTGFTNPNRAVNQIAIVDPMIVWAIALDWNSPTSYIREFTRTTDGGINWTPGTISFTGSGDYGVANIFPMNDTVCYACMFPVTNATGGYIVKTTDGGINWTIQSTASFGADGGWADIVHFFNENDGVAMGDPNSHGFVIYTTSNGGNTWTRVPYSNIPVNLSGETGVTNLYDAVGNTLWFTTSKGRIYKTIDKGATWTVANTGLPNSCTPTFKDENMGIVALNTSPYTLKKTTDGGATWTTFTPTGTFLIAPQLAYVKGTKSMWVDVSATQNSIGSVYSNDDCASFKNIDMGAAQYTAVAFLDSLTGWAGGINTGPTDGGIYKWNPTYDLTTGVNHIPSVSQNLKIYPNPSNDLVTVEFSAPLEASATVTVYNLLGEKVRILNAVSGDNSTNLSVSGLSSGMYILTVQSGGKLITTERLSVVH